MKRKIMLISTVALMTVVPMIVTSTNEVRATVNSAKKTVMHTAIAYDRDDNSTARKYYAYDVVTVDPKKVTIDGNLYYKVFGKNQYLKATNIDGVTRRMTHNAYIYRSSNRRTSFNGKWKLYRGQTVTTYGGSYKFKNGKRYFRVGGPHKQYIKSYNLGPVINTNTAASTDSGEETTVTVKYAYNVNIYDNQGRVIKKNIPKGTKFVVDRLEKTSFADQFIPEWASDGFYRIKGTTHWLVAVLVKADKKLPLRDPQREENLNKYAYITFSKDTNVYNADGTIQNHNGQKIVKQMGQFKVDKLMYIWVPSEKKANLFYHLVGTKFYATNTGTSFFDKIDVGHDAYVKADDVKFVNGVQLTPLNTAAEAQVAAQKK